MVCFGLEPREAGWKAQTIPLIFRAFSFSGEWQEKSILKLALVLLPKYPSKLTKV